jgi:phosphatidylglycerophosphate synthase
MLPIELTYKDSDTEESLDIYFYRPIGYLMARAAQLAGATPNAVTFLSLISGLIAGGFFYSPSIKLIIPGILFLILYEALDSADGQLARMTGVNSEYGRILDGLVGELVFINIYAGLCYRYINSGGTIWIIPLAVAAGLSNSYQAAMADYFRNCYLYFVRGIESSEHGASESIRDKYAALSWRKEPVRKLLRACYLSYILQQELLSGPFLRLKSVAIKRYGDKFPYNLRQEYQALNKPMIKYYNILTVNTRLIALCISLLLGLPLLYFIFEIVVLNLLFAYVLVRQDKIFSSLRIGIETTGGNII